MSLHIVILAAGKGKRMFSDLPKVLHPIAGKPMLSRVIEVASELKPEKIHIVYGHGGQQIREAINDESLNWVLQEQQLGTGHAVLCALKSIPNDALVLVLSADVPLIQAKTLNSLLKCSDNSKSSLTLLVALLDDPSGLGRIVRNSSDEICAIVEEKDASLAEKNIKEIYTGICSAPAHDFARWLPELKSDNAQQEYYLTDCISLAVNDQTAIFSCHPENVMEVQGVNSQLQRQQVERAWQRREAERHLLAGVYIADANRFDIRGELIAAKDVSIDINCVFTGKVTLGEGVTIGPNCSLTNVVIGANTEIMANSVLDGSEIGDNCKIGPFARLRPGTKLSKDCKIGNFVETKNAVFDEGTKASHLSYLGDVVCGKKVNVGAGTITCNYDGVNKYQTTIEDGAFIGSDTQLVAPVKIGKNATIGAGSTIRLDAPAGELTVTEGKQKTIPGWKRPR